MVSNQTCLDPDLLEATEDQETNINLNQTALQETTTDYSNSRFGAHMHTGAQLCSPHGYSMLIMDIKYIK